MTFTLSTDAVNNYGFITKTEGLDISLFEQNPVMLFDHNSGIVLGKWTNIRKSAGKLLADAVFDEQDPFAQQVKSKVEQGFLKSCSIGFNIDYNSITYHNNSRIINKSQLLEASIVAVPANNEARVHLSQDQQDKINAVLHHINSQAATDTEQALKKEIAHLKNTIQQLEQAAAQRIEDDKKTLLRQAVAHKKITEKEAEILSELPLASLSALLEERKPQRSIMEQIKQGGEAPLSFRDLSKNNPEKLAQIRKQQPDLYQSLYEQEYGKSVNHSI